MNKKTIYWLYDQLSEWTAKGWINAETADEMKAFYSPNFARTSPSMARLILLFLGFALIGLGIFLLFAGYWYSFSPNGRFDLAMGLLFIALLVVFLALWRTTRGSMYAEGAAVLYMVTTFASLYLIGDTFYVGDSKGVYLLLSLALSLPLIYLLNASFAMFFYLLGSMVWSLSAHAINFFVGPWAVWILLLAGVPFYIERLRSHNNKFNMLIILSWAYIASIFGVFFFTLDTMGTDLTIYFMACLATSIYTLGAGGRGKEIWSLPFRGLGVIGLLYVVVAATFIGTWEAANLTNLSWMTVFIGCIFLLLPILLGYKQFLVKDFISTFICLTPLILIACYFLASRNFGGVAVSLLFNAYVILAVTLLFLRGSIEKRVALLNGGMVTLFALVGARFIDPGFTFVERGTAFVTAGSAVLVVNGVYMWRKRQKEKKFNIERRESHE